MQEEICRAEQRAEPLPAMRLNLPPGYLDEFRRTFVDKQDEPAREKSLT